ncbi:hypothetical protein V6N11_072871 [Hibiscus sabdariffa]
MPQLENCFLNFRGSESTLQCCLRMKEDTSHALNSVQMMQSGRCARPMVHVVWEQPKLGWVKAIDACNILDAELWGIYEGLSTAWSLHILRVIVETNYKDAVELLSQNPLDVVAHFLFP